MSFFRSLRLVRTHNKQFLLKLRYDLGRELVVLISSLVLLGLFAYIFRDFLDEKLKVIPPAQQAGIARMFALVLLMVLGSIVAAPIRKLWKEDPGLRSFSLRIGENPSTVLLFLLLQSTLLLAIPYVLYWRFAGIPWGQWTLVEALLLQAISLCIAAIRFFLFGEKKANEDRFKPLLNDSLSSRGGAMMHWRLRQIFLRNRLAKLCLLLALLLQIVAGAVLWQGAPFALAVLLAMASGLLTAAATSFQLEEDMRAIWFERQIACSHEEYVDAYQKICMQLALIIALISLAAGFLGRGFHMPLETIKLAAIVALFPAMFPALMFQIAPERSLMQIMTIALIGLFLGTAIFAHWASIIVVPIAVIYAKQYQRNNFYRS